MSMMFWTAVVAFLGYAVAFLYSLGAPEPRERIRRLLTTTSATGIAVVSLLVVQIAVLFDHHCVTIRCFAYAACACMGFAFSIFLVVLESTRRFMNR